MAVAWPQLPAPANKREARPELLSFHRPSTDPSPLLVHFASPSPSLSLSLLASVPLPSRLQVPYRRTGARLMKAKASATAAEVTIAARIFIFLLFILHSGRFLENIARVPTSGS